MTEFYIIDFRPLGGGIEAWSRDAVGFALNNHDRYYNSYRDTERDAASRRKDVILSAPTIWAFTAQEAVEAYLTQEKSR